jgi:hypothetical protein
MGIDHILGCPYVGGHGVDREIPASEIQCQAARKGVCVWDSCFHPRAGGPVAAETRHIDEEPMAPFVFQNCAPRAPFHIQGMVGTLMVVGKSPRQLEAIPGCHHVKVVNRTPQEPVPNTAPNQVCGNRLSCQPLNDLRLCRHVFSCRVH